MAEGGLSRVVQDWDPPKISSLWSAGGELVENEGPEARSPNLIGPRAWRSHVEVRLCIDVLLLPEHVLLRAIDLRRYNKQLWLLGRWACNVTCGGDVVSPNFLDSILLHTMPQPALMIACICRRAIP